MKWYAASDHAGLELRRELVAYLEELGDTVVDLGTESHESVDYPDFAAKVGAEVTKDATALGLLICGTGNGIAMAANKIRGVRAALVTEVFTAEMSRAHNDANICVFGSRVIGSGVAKRSLSAFRDTSYSAGRHARRVDKVMALEE